MSPKVMRLYERLSMPANLIVGTMLRNATTIVLC